MKKKEDEKEERDSCIATRIIRLDHSPIPPSSNSQTDTLVTKRAKRTAFGSTVRSMPKDV
jgi:hypothetical protein